MTNTTSTSQNFKICGWGEGFANKTIANIIMGDGIGLEKNEDFHELNYIPFFSTYCSSEHLENLHFTIAKLADEANTDQSRVLLIESQIVPLKCKDLQGDTRDTQMFRFYHSFSDVKSFANRQHGIRDFWNKGGNNETPHIFYEITIERLTSKKQKSRVEAKQIVDEFIGKIINNYDTIIDLSNTRVYRRKSEIKNENILRKLQNIKTPEFFDCNLIKRAIKEYMTTNKDYLSDLISASRIDFYNHLHNSFKRLEKDNVYIGGICHSPYITEHNMILFRAKNGRESVSFIIDMFKLKQRFNQNENIPIEEVVPIVSPENRSQQLLGSYIMHSTGRIQGTPINTIVQPKVTKISN